MDNPLIRRGIGLLMVLVAAVLAVWLLWPDLDTGAEPVAEAPRPEVKPDRPRPEAASATATEGGEAELVIIEEEPGIPKTEKCTTIADWHARHVPDFTIADNMRDQAMLFTEEDLACLTASDVPPFVLQYAEMHMKKERKPR